MHRNSPKPGNDLEPMWSNNYTQAIRAVALEDGPPLGPGEAPPTNNTNSIDAIPWFLQQLSIKAMKLIYIYIYIYMYI